MHFLLWYWWFSLAALNPDNMVYNSTCYDISDPLGCFIPDNTVCNCTCYDIGDPLWLLLFLITGYAFLLVLIWMIFLGCSYSWQHVILFSLLWNWWSSLAALISDNTICNSNCYDIGNPLCLLLFLITRYAFLLAIILVILFGFCYSW